MAGKRLIDAAKLLNVGTSIAKQHFVLRRQQWDVYSRTSSLAKAVKDQTNRVTVTAAAAVELAKRLDETGPTWKKEQESTRSGRQNASPQTDTTSVDASTNTVTGVSPGGQNIVQEQDSAVSGTGERILDAEHKEQYEWPKGQPSGSTETPLTGQHKTSEISKPLWTDSLSLPRSNLPKHTQDAPSAGPNASSTNLDRDVSPQPTQPITESVPEDINVDIFSSPKVSQMIGRAGPELKNLYTARQRLPPRPLPEMVAAEDLRRQEQRHDSSASFSSDGKDAETQKLAASIAQETEVRRYAQLSSHDILIC